MHLQIYLKTTETCQLDCSHCYTSGKNGAKIFFNSSKVLSFFYRLRRERPEIDSVRITFHGGEPMLAPLDSMWDIVKNTESLWPSVRMNITTNLAYKMTPERKEFLNRVGFHGFGSSFDDMRFDVGSKAYELWSSNSKELSHLHPTMMVSLSKGVIKMHPSELYQIAEENGYAYILFERITDDGSAVGSDIKPSNSQVDDWIYSLFKWRLENPIQKVGDMLLNEIAQAMVGSVHCGNRCRNCESSMITINADGTIAGCPNSAPKDYWGHIDWPIEMSFESQKRKAVINSERTRDPRCYSCDALSICNGDCHQLSWDEQCGAPKKVWHHFLKEPDTKLYEHLILKD